jgi:MFS family permease
MSTLWRHSGFLHLWGAQATSTFGTRIGREAIQLSAVMLLGSGPLDLAWLNLAVSLPYLLFGLAAGILIDRVRRRPLLIATDLIRAFLLATIPIAAWLGAFSLAHLLVAVFLVTACSLVFDAAHLTYVPTLMPMPSRNRRRPPRRSSAHRSAARWCRRWARRSRSCAMRSAMSPRPFCSGGCRTRRRRPRKPARASPGTISRSGS